MSVRTRAIVLGGLAVVAIVAVVLWRGRSDRPAAAPGAAPVAAPPRLDRARFRDLAARRRHAIEPIAARYPRAADASARPAPPIFVALLSPACAIGPAELCAILIEPARACADGDATACLAVGQYLEDTPPRSLLALSFFKKACELGDAEACARRKELASGELVDCAVDALRCARQAAQQHDGVRGAQACDLGVAAGCDVAMSEAVIAGDRAAARAYLTRSCQLGSPGMCQLLGNRLSPDCTGDCFDPDPEQAAAALAFACESGFLNACPAP